MSAMLTRATPQVRQEAYLISNVREHIGEKGFALKKQNMLLCAMEQIGNLIYPHRCPICHEILEDQTGAICEICRQRIRPIGEPRCKKCGRPVRETEELCPDCESHNRSFTEGRGIFLYDEIMRKSVLLFKYGGRKEYGRFFSMALVGCSTTLIQRWRPDLIVPIPMQKKKIRQRGFNQAELLGRYLAEKQKIPFSGHVLIKIHHTKSQKKLSEKERRKNLKQAFQVEQKITGMRILLVDDVFTTGSTIDAAAACLMQAGASEVFFLTVCIAMRE